MKHIPIYFSCPNTNANPPPHKCTTNAQLLETNQPLHKSTTTERPTWGQIEINCKRAAQLRVWLILLTIWSAAPPGEVTCIRPAKDGTLLPYDSSREHILYRSFLSCVHFNTINYIAYKPLVEWFLGRSPKPTTQVHHDTNPMSQGGQCLSFLVSPPREWQLSLLWIST
jgi:hypothetical protein